MKLKVSFVCEVKRKGSYYIDYQHKTSGTVGAILWCIYYIRCERTGLN
jgi:hypothetical protein